MTSQTVTSPPSARVLIVVPAHDEEETIEACLASIDVAVARLGREWPGVGTRTIVVTDACTDRTEERAVAAGAHVIRSPAHSVGAARRAGVEAGLALLVGDHADDWIASTDADSTVPDTWLTEGMRSVGDGADLLIGTVRPDFAGLPEDYRSWWLATHPRGRPNGHVHGANLGVRVSAYRAAAGFGGEATGEDVALVARLRAGSAREVHSDRAEVVTSSRRRGRAPGGYSHYIAEQLRELRAWSSNDA